MRFARARMPMGAFDGTDIALREDTPHAPADAPAWDPVTRHFRRLHRQRMEPMLDTHHMWVDKYDLNGRRSLKYVYIDKPKMPTSLQLSSSVSNKAYYDHGGPLIDSHPILQSTALPHSSYPMPVDGPFPHLKKPSYMSPPCPADLADREAYPELCPPSSPRKPHAQTESEIQLYSGDTEDRGMGGKKPLYAALLPVALVPALVPEESETAMALVPDRATGMWLKVHLKTMQITTLYEARRGV
jgi:hypothetical protein